MGETNFTIGGISTGGGELSPNAFAARNGISAPDTSIMGALNGNNARNRQEYKKQVFNAKQAELNRQYQTQMSNTAVQRRMADMKAGGINPILAGGYAASQPGGATAAGAGAAPQEGVLDGVTKMLGMVARLIKMK